MIHVLRFGIIHVCIVVDEDWCSVFSDGDHVWITGLYGFCTESGNLAEITTQTMNKLKGLSSYTSHLFISIHLELGVYIFAATCIYNGSLKFQIGIVMICQNVLIVYQNNLI